MKVLITGAGALLGQGIIRALERSSLNVRIATADPSPLSAGLFWTDEAYLIRMAGDADYLDRLAEVLIEAKPDVVVPGTDVELPILAEHRDQIERDFNIRVLVSDPRVIAIANDKYLTVQFLCASGLSPPRRCRRRCSTG
jgi:carbamoyl-phosphate synthase large subunit